VYCGKTAEWIQMPFGVVSGVGRRGMCVLERSGDRRREGQFWGICDALFSNYFEDLFILVLI